MDKCILLSRSQSTLLILGLFYFLRWIHNLTALLSKVSSMSSSGLAKSVDSMQSESSAQERAPSEIFKKLDIMQKWAFRLMMDDMLSF